ncbi:MAG: hypothetical protein LBS60_06925 [Deltaproteobacteria bacterium]|jgi:hypothetical protein|nr:hypothetical protein [Deltaproteobacteria bacterium]
MELDTRSNYTSHRDWFLSILKGLDVVLCLTSALECLDLFVGYVHESQIDVYSTTPLPYKNVNCFVVENFDNIEIVEIAGIRCTSVNQTFNDLLKYFDIIDEQSFAQGLSDYYYENGESFDELKIDPQYAEIFEEMKDWAIGFYNYG